MKKSNFILIGFILLKFILQYFLISPFFELHRDEYLHLDQAHHLAWGFQSVPPLTSWISYFINFLGNNIFWIKFIPALFGALTILVVWKAIEALNGNLFAKTLGATCILFSALLRLNILYQPNSLDVLSWTTFYFIIIKYFKSENTKWLFIAAVVFSIGFLNKYNILFLLIGLFPAILISTHRKLFLQPAFYSALILGLLLVSPNLFWQYKNHFPVVNHLKELRETQLVNVDRLGFLKAQCLFFIGSFFVLLFSFYALICYRPFAKYRFFFLTIIFTLFVFIYFKAKDYYAIGIYPIYISFGSVFLADYFKSGWKRCLKPVAILIPFLLFIPFYKIGFPNKDPNYIIQHPDVYRNLGLLRWEDGKDHKLPQDYADMLGWKELSEKVYKQYLKLPPNEYTLILCDNYGQAGAINYYSNYQLKAVSFSADYINWFDLSSKIDNLIRVKEVEGSKNEMMTTKPFFETAVLADTVENPLAREYKTTIFVFKNANIDVNQRIRSEIDKVKNNP